MEIMIPAAIRSVASGGSAVKLFTAWWKKSRGDSRALIGELKDNLIYLDMVAVDQVPLADVIDKLSVTEFKRLSREGFNYNQLNKSRIANYPSLQGTELEPWLGKETEQLIESIYDKLNEIKIRYPHVADKQKYRWGVRVNNIRKRIWLLLKHVSD